MEEKKTMNIELDMDMVKKFAESFNSSDDKNSQSAAILEALMNAQKNKEEEKRKDEECNIEFVAILDTLKKSLQDSIRGIDILMEMSAVLKK